MNVPNQAEAEAVASNDELPSADWALNARGEKVPMPTRTCGRCGETKPIWQFKKRGNTRPAHKDNCKVCNTALRYDNYQRIGRLRLQRDDVKRFMLMRNHDGTWANRYRAPGNYLLEELIALFERYDFKCAYCGGPAECRDHVVPLSRGGTNWITNLLPSCLRCNNRKWAGTLSSFVARWFPNTTLEEFKLARKITVGD